MKKVLALLLLLTLALGVFAGCKNAEVTPIETEPDETTAPVETTAPIAENVVPQPGAEDAMKWLKSQYQDDGALTAIDYTRYGTVRIGKTVFTVVWSVEFGEEVENPDDLIKIEVLDEGATVKINVNEECEEDTPYVLTATITDENGNVVTFSWNYILPKGADMVSIVEEAYALASGESFDHEVRLRGKIISIDSVYDPSYQNITVTIAVEGAEDKPIKCYRLKGEGAEDLLVGNIITVSGIIKNYEGTIEFDAGCILEAVEKGDAVEAPTDVGEILKDAYALAEDTALPYPVTLTGTVTGIDSPYDPNYSNISVILTMEGYEQYPILCYRLKGEGVDQIAIKDQITVTGIIKNYNGTIEFDSGCQMTNRISGGGVAEGPSSDPEKILGDAAELEPGEKLPYIATLTGTITSVDTPYSSEYGNVTVTMKVDGVKIQCFRMVGDGINLIRETDTITVTGMIENYNGKLEFSAKCNLDSWSIGPRPIGYGPLSEGVAYSLYMYQGAVEKTVYFNGKVSGSRLQSSDKGANAVDVFMEKVSGRGVRFYYMNGSTKTYIEIEEYTNSEGKVRGRALVTTTPSCVWNYNSELGIYAVNLPTAGKYFLGTYNTYETFTASWVGYIDGTISGSSAQYVAKFMKASDVPVEEPSDTVVQGTPVENPVPGTAYKFGFYQNKKDGKPFLAFNGKMAATYYFGTADVIADMVDVYLEAADSGYYIYFMNGNTKTYLDIVPRANDATKVNVVMQTSGTHTVYSLNSEHQYVYASVAGSEWYLGTYDANTTISASKTSYISDTSTIGVSQFCAWFNTVAEVEAPEEPDVTEPTEPGTSVDATVVTQPVYSTPYKLGMDKGDGSVLYFTGNTESASVTYRLETTTDASKAVDVYLEEVPGVTGGAYLYFMKDGVKTYIRVFHRTDGDPGYGKGSLEFVTSAPSEYYGWSVEASTLIYDYDGNNAYYMGTYGTYVTISVSNTSYITGDKASTVDVSQFPARFYTVEEGEEPDVTEPDVTEPASGNAGVVESPEVGTGYKLGMDKGDGSVLYFTGNTESASVTYRLETSTDASKAVDVYLEAADGGYRLYFMNGSTKTYIRVFHRTDGDPGYGKGSLEYVTSAPAEVFTYDETVKTLIYDYDGNNAYYMGTYGTYVTISVSNTSYITGDKASTVDVSQFPVRFYTVEEGEEPDVTEPDVTTPDVTEPGTTGDGYNKISSASEFTTGKYVMIVNTGYAPGAVDGTWLTAVQPVVSGNSVTDTKGAVWTLTVTGSSVTIADANGNLIGPKGGNYNGLSSGSYDWSWTCEDGTFVFAGVGEDTVYLASNSSTTGDFPGNHRFRGYKTSTVNKYPAEYPYQFTLYKLGGEYVEPDVTEPDVTTPDVTEPAANAGVVADPQVETAYKLGMDKGDGQILYFTGNTESADVTYRLETTTDASKAIDVKLEAADGGYRLYFMNGSTKTYIRVYHRTDGDPGYGKGSLEFVTSAPAEVFTYDETAKTLIYDYDGNNAYYMGTYGTYSTFSVSNTSYITGGNAGNVDATQFPARFYTVEAGSVEPDVTEPDVTTPDVTEPAANAGVVADPQVETAYKLGMDKGDGQILYFTGNTESADVTYRLETTTDASKAIDVKLEAADGGYRLYFMNGSTKTYIRVYHRTDGDPGYGKGSLEFVTSAPAEVFTYDETAKTLIYDYDGDNAYYMGTYGTYSTFSVSNTSYITGGNAGNVDATQFPARFYTVEAGSVEPEVTEPEATEPEETTPSAGTSSVTYNFANCTKGEQYTAGETYELDAVTSLYLVGGHMNTQLRLYDDAKGDAIAKFTCTKVINSVAINACYTKNAATLMVYASVDGETWVEIEAVSTQTAYADYTVEIPTDAEYKYLKLDAVGGQIRVASMIFNFA